MSIIKETICCICDGAAYPYPYTIHGMIRGLSKYRKRNTVLKDIVDSIIEEKLILKTSEMIAQHFNIARVTARKHLRRLAQLRWLKKDLSSPYENELNPFLELMIRLHSKYKCLSEFVPHQVDLFDVLCIPLLEALSLAVVNVEIVWSQMEPHHGYECFPKRAYTQIYPYFNGIVQFRIKTNTMPDICTVLPYNIHWTGKNPHVTLPIMWKFYGIKEATYKDDNTVKVHFDKSITVAIPLGSASWATRKGLHKYNLQHWSDQNNRFMQEYWKNEYVEAWNFDSHEKLIGTRLMKKSYQANELIDGTLRLTRNL